MKPRQFIALLALPLLGCGPSKQFEVSLQSMERNQAALKMQQAETQRKMEDLSNSLMVLQDRLETLKVAADRQPVPVVPTPKPRKKAKAKLPAAEEETGGESAFGFGQAGGSHLPTLQFTNRDLDASGSKGRKKEPARVEEERTGVPENPEAARVYNEAFRRFEEENYPEAVRMLEEFVAKYPAHVYADNAVFWIGESHFRTRDFARAAEQFERVGREFPTGNKVPDALLRAASCYLRLNKPAEARRTFERIIATYPQSVAAQKARASLSEISGAEEGRT